MSTTNIQIAFRADAGGTANAITANFTPDISLTNKTLVIVRAATANTSGTVTFTPDAAATKNVTKRGNKPLRVGDIAGAGHELMLMYNSTNDVWELLNPALSYPQMLGKNFTPASGTNTTGEELIQSFEVTAGQINTSDYLDFYALAQWNNSGGTKTFKIYFSPTASLADVNKVQVGQAQATTNTGTPITRRFLVKGDTSIRSHIPATNNFFLIDAVTAGANVPTDITVPSLTAGFFVLISGQKGTGTDTDTIDYSLLMKRV